MALSGIITSCIFYMEIGKEELLPATLTSEPIPTSRKIPVGTLVTRNETERTLSLEFQWRSLPEYKKNFWKMIIPLCSVLIGILTSLMTHCILL
jgi:hypothetical protein